MIRRHVGNEFWLITQNDHAILSGELAEQFGANGYTGPDQRTTRATALHDCGWPLHDDSPTLNASGLPLDVFETPRHIGIVVWSASAERAAHEDAYAGLLVSLHSLWISVVATSHATSSSHGFDMHDRLVRFEINKFQQAQVELQERLRTNLGMRIDEPRRFGLAEHSDDLREKQLIFDFRLLQAMDRLSLAMCCTQPPMDRIEPLPDRPGGANRPLRVRREKGPNLSVDPWPFRSPQIRLVVPFRRVPATPFESEQHFRHIYASARVERFDVELSPTPRQH